MALVSTLHSWTRHGHYYNNYRYLLLFFHQELASVSAINLRTTYGRD
ncbi:unnamed protein product [Amoebophrya sp. A25]|nr:unnamed protein product [Amoebophrya sp. A25]|eukprot:GSA25T00000457001.1